MKKNILLSILLGGLSIFIILFGLKTYEFYRFLHIDNPIDPYLQVVTGNATIVRGQDLAIDMGSGEVYDIDEGDIIITDFDSLAVINWPDHSTTRLGPKTRLTIHRMKVADDYSAIEIELAIEQGKIWSSVVRTLYPGSYFRTRLPEGGIIAGVRGTVFDINLDLSYIRSIEHGVTLTDNFGHKVSLLPGEAVNARNILEKVSGVIRDRLWIELNTLRDSADTLVRTSRIDENIHALRSSTESLWGKFVSRLLSYFEAFRGLEILRLLGDIHSPLPSDISRASLLQWYQHFQDKKFVQERESIRLALAKIVTDDGVGSLSESLARSAIWDSMSFSGMTLESADIFARQYTKNLDARLKNVLKVVPLKDIGTQARETLRSLIQ